MVKAFLSYAWESDEHTTWVRGLAERLRFAGIDAILDQWHTAPGDQLPHFMEKSVRESDFVLIICTPAYKKKSDSRKGGVGYEGDIMTGEIFASVERKKFIPILRSGNWRECAPSWLLGSFYIDSSGVGFNEKAFADLLRTLSGQRTLPPAVGKTAIAMSSSRRNIVAKAL